MTQPFHFLKNITPPMISFDPAKNVIPNTMDFKPPLPNPLIQKLFSLLIPQICEKALKGLSISIDAQSMERLRRIKGERCLILPNHPSEWDPCVMFDIARQLRENFFFVAAREVFDFSYGIRGWFFQKLGVYSLVRGSNDRRSLKTSMDILSQNKGRLVIFVEGEISNQNESLLPLEPGVVQLAFMALNEAYKTNGKNLEALPSLYVCPVGIRYEYQEAGLDHAIESAIVRLEQATDMNPADKDWLLRTKALAHKVLEGAAAQVGFTLDPEKPDAENVAALSLFMLRKLEQVINLEEDSGLTYLDRIRRIRNKVDKILTQTLSEEPTFYERHLHQHQKAVLKHFHHDLDRLVNFVSIYDGYLQPSMEKHRYVEILRRLEREVFGSFVLVHPRVGVVQVQEPIDLKAHFADFLQDKKATVKQVTTSVEQAIYQGILGNEAAPADALAASRQLA